MRATASKDTQTFERLLSTRHSCRGFLREPVADDLIVRIRISQHFATQAILVQCAAMASDHHQRPRNRALS